MRRSTFSPVIPCRAAIFFFLSIGVSGLVSAQQTSAKRDTTTTSKDIEQVVIVGYGKQKKTDLTSAVSTISDKVLQDRPVPTVANMIQGAAPGLVVTRTSGRPGAQGINIVIRGATSASGTVAPLFVIDGIVSSQQSFLALNPNDIQSISVLKDGGATAIYGAQSAGGVVIVTTKTGKSGKSQISFSSSTAFSRPSNLPKRLSLIDEMNYVNLARKNAGISPEYSAVDLDRAVNGPEFVVNPTNGLWQTYNQESLIDQVMKKTYGLNQNNLQISGGNQKVTYLFSVGNMQQQGIFKIGEDYFSRWNGRLNLTAIVNKYLKLELNNAYASQAVNNPQDGGYGIEGGGNGILRQFYSSRMRFPIFNPDGTYYISGTSSAFGYGLLKDGGFNRDRSEDFTNNVSATITHLVKGLDIKFVYGRESLMQGNRNFRRTVNYYSGPLPNSLKQLNNPNSYSRSESKTISENFQSLIDYTVTLGENNHIHALAGYQLQKYRFNSMSATTKNLFVNDNPSLNFTSDPHNKSNSESIASDALQSYFGRLNYDYAGKYLFEFTIRRDESSRLTASDRDKIFPSFSAGWNISKENWFDGIRSVVSNLKPRVSWGKVGSNVGIGYYDFIAQLSTGSNLLLGGNQQTTYVVQNALPAQILGWETVETKDAGLDFGMFNNKLSGSFDYYIKNNNNMLVPISLPATIGLSLPMQNAGKLRTWGWELSLNYSDQIGSDFKYNIGFNLADNQNKLVRYDGASNVINEGVNSLVEGFALNSIWGYKTDGYFQNANDLKNAPSYSRLLNAAGVPGLGDVRYVDINGNGEIDPGKNTVQDHGDLVYLGDTNPRYQFGLNLGMSYKNWDMSVFVQGIAKRKFKPTNELMEPQLFSWYQPMTFQMDYWTPDNPNAAFPRP